MNKNIQGDFQICISVPLIVHNLLINYLNLIKASIQKQLPTAVLQLFQKIRSSRYSQMLFEIGVLKNFAIFRGKYPCLFLIKLQVCNFPVNITKFLRTAFFMKHLRWLLSEKFRNFAGKHRWRRSNRFIFLINTTEQDSISGGSRI